jgi:uncharacterized membrane protein YesL
MYKKENVMIISNKFLTYRKYEIYNDIIGIFLWTILIVLTVKIKGAVDAKDVSVYTLLGGMTSLLVSYVAYSNIRINLYWVSQLKTFSRLTISCIFIYVLMTTPTDISLLGNILFIYLLVYTLPVLMYREAVRMTEDYIRRPKIIRTMRGMQLRLTTISEMIAGGVLIILVNQLSLTITEIAFIILPLSVINNIWFMIATHMTIYR